MAKKDTVKLPSFEAIESEIEMILESFSNGEDKDLDEETKAELDAYLDELGTQEAKKIDGICQFFKFQKKRIDEIREEARALSTRASSMERSLKYLKEHYLKVMDSEGLPKVTGACYSIYIQSRPKAVVPEVIDYIPEEYITVKTERFANKERILADLQAGISIPGCSLGESRYIVAR